MDSANVLPPSYSAATGQHSSFGELNFVDFVPQSLDPGAILRPVFESFNVLIDRANAWLLQTPQWEVKTCESVEFKATYNALHFESMSYLDYGKVATYFIRGLRLWIVSRVDPSRPPQQIGYINAVPLELQNGVMETLDLVLDRLNKELLLQPLPGRILTIETQEMRVPGWSAFDPNVSLFVEKAAYCSLFVFVIRLFYEVSEPANEVVGVATFVPTRLQEGSLFSPPAYEPFSNVINTAFHWCAQQTGIRFCNAQSVEVMMSLDRAIDTQQMSYTEYRSRRTFFVRVLRVAYAKLLPNTVGYMPVNSPALNLTFKTFVPVLIANRTFRGPEFETLSQTKQRIVAWVRATGAKVVSAETCAVRLFGYFGTAGPDTSFTYTSEKNASHWMFIIRLYLDGYYPEPPAEVLPPVPVIQKDNSCVVL